MIIKLPKKQTMATRKVKMMACKCGAMYNRDSFKDMADAKQKCEKCGGEPLAMKLKILEY